MRELPATRDPKHMMGKTASSCVGSYIQPVAHMLGLMPGNWPAPDLAAGSTGLFGLPVWQEPSCTGFQKSFGVVNTPACRTQATAF